MIKSHIKKSLKQTIIQGKFVERMLKDNRHLLVETNNRLKLLNTKQFDIRRDTTKSLKNVARA